MINVQQLRELIIKPALNDLHLYSEDAEELLVFTCAVESGGGTYIKQINGPALGIYQMEPETYWDIRMNYLPHKQSLSVLVSTMFGLSYISMDEYRLVHDLRFATAMCRIHYARVPEALPAAHDLDNMWDYYKTYYNTLKGAAKRDESISKYLAYINS
jgi:hypothetical protein